MTLGNGTITVITDDSKPIRTKYEADFSVRNMAELAAANPQEESVQDTWRTLTADGTKLACGTGRLKLLLSFLKVSETGCIVEAVSLNKNSSLNMTGAVLQDHSPDIVDT